MLYYIFLGIATFALLGSLSIQGLQNPKVTNGIMNYHMVIRPRVLCNSQLGISHLETEMGFAEDLFYGLPA